MAATVAAVMTAIEAAIVAAHPELRTFGFPPKSAQPPFMFVSPQQVDYDLTYGRAFDTHTLDVYVAVAAPVDNRSWDQITAYADGTAIKAAIDGIGSGYRVESVTFGEIQLASGTYLGAVFTVSAKV